MQEQLAAGHLEPTTSPWNTPIFVIKKKSGAWRLLQDLREINKTMFAMGALQPGLPSPVAIPANHAKITPNHSRWISTPGNFLRFGWLLLIPLLLPAPLLIMFSSAATAWPSRPSPPIGLASVRWLFSYQI